MRHVARCWFRALAGVLIALGVAEVASASTVLRFGPDELADRAQVVVHGTVISKQARQLPNGDIVTDHRVEVKALLKGARGRLLSFTTYGGVLGDRGQAVAGAPIFAVGEQILVFLGKTNAFGCRLVIGLAQGKYTIRKVEDQLLAFRDLEGLRLLDPKTGKVEEARKEQGVPFGELLERVRTRIAAKAAKAEAAKAGTDTKTSGSQPTSRPADSKADPAEGSTPQNDSDKR